MVKTIALLLAGVALALASPARADAPASVPPPATPTSTPATAPAPPPVRVLYQAPARPAQAAPPTEPALHHIPLSTAREHQPLAISATLDRPDLVRRATLVYRHGSQISEVAFARSTSLAAPYVAVIPAEHVVRPSLAYALEIERADGTRAPVFATRDAMQTVEVVGDTTDAREEALLARLHGRRFVTSVTGEYASFGTVSGQVCPTSGCSTTSLTDSFYHVEGSFTYRLLRTVSEFGVRVGVYRGTSFVPNATDPSQFNVGLNYGAPWVRIRATDWLHFEGEFLASVTEVGFSVGGGGSVILGDAYGSNLTLGFESIEVFGTRGFTRFDVQALRWLKIAPIVEVTTMPHASTAGVRLLTDLTFDLGHGFGLTARGGYQARSFASGGPSAGGAVTYAF